MCSFFRCFCIKPCCFFCLVSYFLCSGGIGSVLICIFNISNSILKRLIGSFSSSLVLICCTCCVGLFLCSFCGGFGSYFSSFGVFSGLLSITSISSCFRLHSSSFGICNNFSFVDSFSSISGGGILLLLSNSGISDSFSCTSSSLVLCILSNKCGISSIFGRSIGGIFCILSPDDFCLQLFGLDI